MALSKPQTPMTPQHYLECETNECERNCQFYCNHCTRRLCEQCREEHLKSPASNDHEVVLFQKRKRQLPVQKCQIHLSKDIDMLCEQCQVAVCSKCATQDHQRHTFRDLETIYTVKCAECLEEISKIQEYFLPTVQDLQKEKIKMDAKEIKTIIDSIRTSMKTEAESLKSLVDIVTSDNIDEVNRMEKLISQMLKSQDLNYENYISYLHELVKKFHGYLSSTNLQKVISAISENSKIQPIPETTKPIPPEFTPGNTARVTLPNFLVE